MNIPDEYFKEGGWVKPIDINASVNRIAILVAQDDIDIGLNYFVDAVISKEELKRYKNTLETLKIAKINNAKRSLSDIADSFINPTFYNFETESWEKI